MRFGAVFAGPACILKSTQFQFIAVYQKHLLPELLLSGEDFMYSSKTVELALFLTPPAAAVRVPPV